MLAGAFITATDQLVKHHAETHPECYREIVHNRGFAGERLKNRPEIVRIVSLILMVFGISILFFIPDDTASSRLRKSGWTLIMAGGLSNTLDRMIRHYVVDYIPRGKYVYNLGDFAIGAGAAGFLAGTLIPETGMKGGNNENSGNIT